MQRCDKLKFIVPYHTGYAHIELINAFSSYADVYLFVYKWNPSRERVENYFSKSESVNVKEFSIDSIIESIIEEEKQGRRIVVLLTASLNYPFGQYQYRLFNILKENLSSIIDVYSTGHCMYGCQSCTYQYSHRLPITFTNYIINKHKSINDSSEKCQMLILPSFPSKEAPFSLLSNKEIIETILHWTYSYRIKLHPLTYPFEGEENPLFCLSQLEKESVKKLFNTEKVLLPSETNTLKLIEDAHLIICDSDSSIPFETLYFKDQKYIFVYETIEQSHKEDDRRRFFHIFRNCEELNHLIELYFQNQLQCKTTNRYQFFLQKYDQPDGLEIERLANKRQWSNNQHSNQNIDLQQIKQTIDQLFSSNLTKIVLYALGQHTTEQINQLLYQHIDQEFAVLLNNIDQL